MKISLSISLGLYIDGLGEPWGLSVLYIFFPVTVKFSLHRQLGIINISLNASQEKEAGLPFFLRSLALISCINKGIAQGGYGPLVLRANNRFCAG